MSKSKTQRHEFYTEVWPHHKGVLLPIEKPTSRPTRSRQPLSQIFSTSGWYKLLGVVHKFGDSQATYIIKEHKVPRVTNLHNRVFTTSSRDRERGGRTKTMSEIEELKPHMKAPSINRQGRELGCERGVKSFCIKFSEQWMYWSANVNERGRGEGIYRGSLKRSWQFELFAWNAVETDHKANWTILSRAKLGSIG
jgi:hypothetical protein